MSCSACADFHLRRNKVPDCARCKKPFLDIGNEVAWEIYCQASSQIRTAGMGTPIGIDFTALPFILTTNQVPEADWAIILQKLMEIQNIALKIAKQIEERQKASQTPPPTSGRK